MEVTLIWLPIIRISTSSIVLKEIVHVLPTGVLSTEEGSRKKDRAKRFISYISFI